MNSAHASITARLVALAIVACVLEGAGRKWIMPNSTPQVQAVFYFAKDVILVLAAVSALRCRTRLRNFRRLGVWFGIGAVLIAIAVALNLEGLQPVGAILTLRALVVLPCLALLIAPGIRSQADFNLILKTIGYLSIGVAVLGALQFSLPADHILNQQVESTVGAISDMGRVRACGPFAFSSGMNSLTLAACWAGVCFVLVQPRRISSYVFVLAALGCALAAISRAGFLLALAMLGTAVIRSRASIPAWAFVIAIAGIWFFTASEPDEEGEPILTRAVLVRYQRADDSFETRIGQIVQELFDAVKESPLGTGLGQGQGGGTASVLGTRGLRGAETESGRIVFEIGILGLLGVMVFRLAILTALWKSLSLGRQAANHTDLLYEVRRGCFFALGLWFATNTCFDHVASFFAWTIGAVGLAALEGGVARGQRAEGRGQSPAQGSGDLRPAQDSPLLSSDL